MEPYCMWFTAETVCFPAQVWAAWTQGILSAIAIGASTGVAVWLSNRAHEREEARRDTEKDERRRQTEAICVSAASTMLLAIEAGAWAARNNDRPETFNPTEEVMTDTVELLRAIDPLYVRPEALQHVLALRRVAAEAVGHARLFVAEGFTSLEPERFQMQFDSLVQRARQELDELGRAIRGEPTHAELREIAIKQSNDGEF